MSSCTQPLTDPCWRASGDSTPAKPPQPFGPVLDGPVRELVTARRFGSKRAVTISCSTKPDAAAAQVAFFTAAERAKLPAGITREELSLKPNSRVFHHASNTLCVGLGETREVKADTLRRAAGAAAMLLRKTGRGRVCIALGEYAGHAAAIVEGFILGDYAFEDFKPTKTRGSARLTLVAPAAKLPAVRRAAAHAQTLGEAANLARRVANQPGNAIYPESLAELARWNARDCGLRFSVLDERRLRAGKFGGILAVGGGSARPPRLIVIEHRGGPRGEAPLALVGKAVTFDTGGISIKPAADMEKMIWDKCGGAAVLGAMIGLARLGVRRNVVGLIPAAENMPGSRAYRPGDIVRCLDGTNVEIVNTDAEGRMLLADAIAYARKKFAARAIVDVATLTGACGIALGEYAAGLWSTKPELANDVLAAAADAGEQMWQMPLFPEYDAQIQSQMAQIKNSGGRFAGACTAAAFLKTFAGPVPWAHLDIAYPARLDRELPWLARGATGFAVRTLVNLATRLA